MLKNIIQARNIKKALYVPEKSGAVLHSNGYCSRFEVRYSDETTLIEHAFELKPKKRIRNLFTDKIILCAGVILRNKNSWSLIHADSYKSLEILLERASQDILLDSIEHIDICTPTIIDYPTNNYLSVLRSLIPKIHPILHQRRGIIGLVKQEVACGKDIFYTGKYK